MDSENKFWLGFWGIVTLGITAIFSILIVAYYSARVQYVKAGLQECADYGSPGIFWQKECRK